MSFVSGSTIRQLLVGCAVVALATVPGVAMAQVTSNQAGSEEEGDVILVTGVRQSLAQSVDQKRGADRIVDVITAEDIGELPDANVAESLQRITGVQVARLEGQGNTVRIRGLASQVQINGRSLAAQDTDRSFNLFNLSSDFFQTLEVSKSIVASQTEGTLGGVINLKTRRALDLKDRLISLTGAVKYEEFADKAGTQLSGTFADKFADGRVGFIVTVSHDTQRFREDQFQSLGGWERRDIGFNTGFDFNKDGVANDVLRPLDLRYTTGNDRFERFGVDASIQLQPTDNLELSLDANYSNFSRERNRYFLQMLTSNAGLVPGSAVISENGSLLAATYNGQDVRPDGRALPEVYLTRTYGAHADWTLGRLTVSGDASISYGNRNLVSQFLRFGLPTGVTTSFDFRTSTGMPDITLSGGNLDLHDPSLYVTNLVFDRLIDIESEEKTGKLDLKYDFDNGDLRAISLGGRISARDFSEHWFQVPTGVTQANYPLLFDTNGNRLTAATSPLNQFVTNFPFSNGMFPGVEGNFPRSWFVGTYPLASIRQGSKVFPELLKLRANGVLPETLSASADIIEDTYAGYVMADFKGTIGGRDYNANLGLRVVRTELSSAGFASVGGVFRPVVIDNSYTNVLPSANFMVELMDDLVVRLAGAKVLQRPDISALKTGFSVNQTSMTATGGNPTLDPFEATQFDASIEYYMGRDGLVSAAFFYKDVKNFITQSTQRGTIPGVTGHLGETEFLISRPVNGGAAKIHGFELSFQQAFTSLPGILSGLGVVANYTYSHAKAKDGFPFPALSKHTYNLIGYYDKGPIDFRLAYSFRSKFQTSGDGGNAARILGLADFAGSQGYLDASASYDISDAINIRLEAQNLTKTKERIYLEIPERLSTLRYSGRRYLLGIRASL